MVGTKKYILKFCLLIMFSIQLSVLKSQDLQFSQFENSPLMLNPSLTGAFEGKMRLSTNYRNQWNSISSPYRTIGFVCDVRLSDQRNESGFLGLGIALMSDKAGISRMGSNQANLTVAYHVRVTDDNYFSAGIIAGGVQRGFYNTNLEWNSQYDGNGGFDGSLPSSSAEYTETKMYLDLGAGLNWAYSTEDVYSAAVAPLKMQGGVAFFHLNKQDISLYSAEDKLPLKIIAHANAEVDLNWSGVSILPSALYVRQGVAQNITAGLVVRKLLKEGSKVTGLSQHSAISVGCLYRVGDAFIPYWQLEMSSFKLGVSYDVNSSPLTDASLGRGGVEISLSWLMGSTYSY